MIKNVTKQEIESTKSLDETVKMIFGISGENRTMLFPYEQMQGNLAKDYDRLGAENRQETYRRIAIDFRTRCKCYSSGPNFPAILDIGCGSGLLSFELARETNSRVVGIDLSKVMIELARERLETQEKRIKDSIKFEIGSAYDLQNLPHANNLGYIVCRNVLHRLNEPERALIEMHSSLKTGGQIYIRDLRRDANWQVILRRIGKRWSSPELVRDYIGAMAQMFTASELETMLKKLSITDYTITKGDYKHESSLDVQAELQDCKPGLNEFEKQTEYVCVIRKNGK